MNIKTKKILSLLIGMIFLMVTPATAAEIGTIHDTPSKKDNNNLQPTYKPQQSTHTQINNPLKNQTLQKKPITTPKTQSQPNPTLNELNFNLKETQNDCKEIYEPTREIYNQTCAEIKNLTQNQTKLKQEYQEVKLNNSNISKQLKSFNTRNLTPKQKKEEKLLKEQYERNLKLLKKIENNLNEINKKIEPLKKNLECLNNVLNGLNKTINAKTKASALPGINKIDYNMETMNLAESQINSLNEIVAKYKQNNTTTNKTKNKINSTKAATLATEGGTALLLNTYTAVSLLVWKTHNKYAATSTARLELCRNLLDIKGSITTPSRDLGLYRDSCLKLPGQISGHTNLICYEQYTSLCTRSKWEIGYYNRLIHQIKDLHIKGEEEIIAPLEKVEKVYADLYAGLCNIQNVDPTRRATWLEDVQVRIFNLIQKEEIDVQFAHMEEKIYFKLLEQGGKEGLQITQYTTVREIAKMAETAEKHVVTKGRILRTNFGIGAVVSVVFDIYFAASMCSWAGYEIGLWEKDYVNDFVDELCSDTFNYLTS